MLGIHYVIGFAKLSTDIISFYCTISLESRWWCFCFIDEKTIVVQSLSHVQLFATPWTAAHLTSLSFTISWSLFKLMSIESVMPSKHLLLCHHLLLLPSILPSTRVFSNESALCIRWPKYWSFSFNISPSNEYSGLISFRINWFDLLAVQGTLKSLLQHHNSKASVLQHSAFFLTLPRYNWYIILFKYKTKCQFGNLNK